MFNCETNIYHASIEDMSVIMELIRGANQEVAQLYGLTADNCPKHPSNYTKDRVSADFEKGAEYFVAQEAGKAIGCVAIEKSKSGKWYIERLAVDPAHQKKGYGRKLMDEALRGIRNRGGRWVSIGIIADQLELKRWYESFGFIETETKEFAHLPFRVTLMLLDLDPGAVSAL